MSTWGLCPPGDRNHQSHVHLGAESTWGPYPPGPEPTWGQVHLGAVPTWEPSPPGGRVHLEAVSTWGSSALGGCAHLGAVSTWGPSTLGGCAHLGTMSTWGPSPLGGCAPGGRVHLRAESTWWPSPPGAVPTWGLSPPGGRAHLGASLERTVETLSRNPALTRLGLEKRSEQASTGGDLTPVPREETYRQAPGLQRNPHRGDSQRASWNWSRRRTPQSNPSYHLRKRPRRWRSGGLSLAVLPRHFPRVLGVRRLGGQPGQADTRVTQTRWGRLTKALLPDALGTAAAPVTTKRHHSTALFGGIPWERPSAASIRCLHCTLSKILE